MNKQKIIMICENCLSRNYSFFKNENYSEKLELKKYCPTCNKHTLHKETR